VVTKIDKSKHTLIASRVSGGETLQSIADDLGVTRERIRQIARHCGVVPSRITRDTRDELIKAQADQIVKDREWWIPSRFSERGFTRAQFEEWLFEHDGLLLARWVSAQDLPTSTTGVANPNQRRCVMCHEWKPWSEFYNDRHGVNGKAQKCADCSRAEVEMYRQRRNYPEPTVTEKRCAGCGETKLATSFSRLTSATSGLQSRCKECQK